MMLLSVVVAMVVVGVGVGLVARIAFADRKLPADRSSDAERLLHEQAERIDELEEELRRVREQADFTEKLLEERQGDELDRLPPAEGPGEG